MARVVTLTTDFGLIDSYVAEVKAVLLRGGVQSIVDISHAVPPFKIRLGAFQLMRAYWHFPKGSIHLAVVDPGVGTERRALYIKTKFHHFVGPDNGLLAWAVTDAVERFGGKAEVFAIEADPELSPTFHGRDLFSPFVASLAKGRQPKGKRLSSFVGSPFPRPAVKGAIISGEVILADHFGNLVTNVPIGLNRDIAGELVTAGRRFALRSVATYDALDDKPGLIQGSHGFWEISLKQKSAAEFVSYNPASLCQVLLSLS